MKSNNHLKFIKNHQHFWFIVFTLGTLLIMTLSQASAVTCFVSTDGSGTGSSWSDTTLLQTALGDPSCDSIWAQQGTYYPTTGTDRNFSFVIDRELTLYGGFNGTESTIEERDFEINTTVLSGNIGDQNIETDNSYHVVLLDNSINTGLFNTDTIIDGFTIQDGYANGLSFDNNAGGLKCTMNLESNPCSPALRNLIFKNHYASGAGGAISNISGNLSSIPVIKNVQFLNNESFIGGAMIYSPLFNSNLVIEDVTFEGNQSTFRGGAFEHGPSRDLSYSLLLNRVNFIGNTSDRSGAFDFNITSDDATVNVTFNEVNFVNNEAAIDGGAIDFNVFIDNPIYPTFFQTSFIGNHAGRDGGAINNTGGLGGVNAQFENVTFVGNTADNQGGVLWNFNAQGNSEFNFNHVTFYQNSALNAGGAIYNAGNTSFLTSKFNNVIMWGNTAPTGSQMVNNNPIPVISNSLIEGGCPSGSNCTNVIDADPMVGSLGHYGGFTQTVPLLPGSAGIDTADNASCADMDQRGFMRPRDGDGDGFSDCDLGAFELREDLIYMDGFEG